MRLNMLDYELPYLYLCSLRNTSRTWTCAAMRTTNTALPSVRMEEEKDKNTSGKHKLEDTGVEGENDRYVLPALVTNHPTISPNTTTHYEDAG